RTGRARRIAKLQGGGYCSGGPRSASAVARSLNKMTAGDLANCRNVGGPRSASAIARSLKNRPPLQLDSTARKISRPDVIFELHGCSEEAFPAAFPFTRGACSTTAGTTWRVGPQYHSSDEWKPQRHRHSVSGPGRECRIP